MTSGLYHGITTKDAAYFLGVTESTVRNWMQRYDLPRTGDGQIDPFAIQEWWDYKRDHEQARRRGNQGVDREAS
jgi:hypothetical protein